MSFYFPQFQALYMADNCVATLHNLLTPRGAQVRDARAWSGYLYEAIDLFGEKTSVVFMGHNWPRWGAGNVSRFLKKQADIYKYIHDQTLRLANQGYRPAEIAERLEAEAPDTLAKEWFNRGYYATPGWNTKAVYQYYLGWYDGNPANYNPLPPVEAGRKYVEFMGGADQVLAKAKTAFDKGDYRWVAQVVNHVVFADPENKKARDLQADALEQLGYQSESAVFRNFYLFGAKELRDGVKKPFARMPASPDVFQALTPDLVFDSLATRLNPQKAAGKSFVVNWQFTDTNERYVLKLENSVLNNSAGKQAQNADCTIKLARAAFSKIFSGQAGFPAMIQSGQVVCEGDIKKFAQLMPMLDVFDLWFNIVSP
jgi:alkyl sulfatase BDS1-like metallo-beta-lactamase superfamily hydrolase